MFIVIADQATKMYKNVLGADVSEVLVSKVFYNKLYFCFQSPTFVW